MITVPPAGKYPTDDVAVLKLDKPVYLAAYAKVPPIGFLDRKVKDGSIKTASQTYVGLGAIDVTQGGERVRNFTRNSVTVSHNYQSINNHRVVFSQNPTKVPDAGGTCFGDSGGPGYWGGMSSKLQFGVISTGDAVCKNTNTLARLDTQEVHAFLRANGVPVP